MLGPCWITLGSRRPEDECFSDIVSSGGVGTVSFCYVEGGNYIQTAYSYNREFGTTGCISQSVK